MILWVMVWVTAILVILIAIGAIVGIILASKKIDSRFVPEYAIEFTSSDESERVFPDLGAALLYVSLNHPEYEMRKTNDNYIEFWHYGEVMLVVRKLAEDGHVSLSENPDDTLDSLLGD